MKLRRGDLITAALPGDLKKPRPAVVLQADEFIEGHRTVLVCPCSTYLADAPYFRPTLEPTEENGLEHRSQVMIDKTTPAKIAAIGAVIGRLSADDMARVEAALINITGLRLPILPLTRLSKTRE
jgi:mRNA interferase MazF